jgi:5-methylcytosine-specific restriction protein A
MAWDTSDRRYRLPSNWPQIRLFILRRDNYECQIPGCFRQATDVDHIVHGDDHDPSNLQAICKPCHAFKSSQEGHARLKELRALTKRKPEKNPGAIPFNKAKPRATKGW